MMNNCEQPISQTLQEHIPVFQQLRDSMMGQGLEPEVLPKLLANELDIARVANRLNLRRELLQALANCTTFAITAVLCETQCNGRVEMSIEPLNGIHTCDVGKTGLSVPLWLDSVMAAIILRDKAAVSALANKILLEKLTEPGRQPGQAVGDEPFWKPYGEAVIALLAGDKQTLGYVEVSMNLMNNCRSYVDPACLLSVDRPLLELIAGLTFGDVMQWQRIFEKSSKAYQDYYQREENSLLLPGLFPIGLTALAALAYDKGFAVDTTVPLIPMWLVRSECDIEHCKIEVTYHYPQKSILTVNEAHWFLDLQGFPRAGRNHKLIEKKQQLVACYEAEGAPNLPKAVAEFVLLDIKTVQTSPVSPPLAVDAGELLFLAESFADHVESNRVLLADAVACVNALIARIPPEQDTISPESIVSPEGKALYTAEPGRFRRDRLITYRNALQLQLDNIDSGHTNVTGSLDFSTSTDADAFYQEVSATAIDVIRSQAEPILKAIANDFTGQYVQTLKPKDTDYEQVFVGKAVAVARQTYTSMWNKGFKIEHPTSVQNDIHCYVAPAGFLTKYNPLSRYFPQGYQSIAGWLNPHRVWVTWSYLKPGSTSGLSYDGLVFVDNRWVWFPKPYRILSQLGLRQV